MSSNTFNVFWPANEMLIFHYYTTIPSHGIFFLVTFGDLHWGSPKGVTKEVTKGVTKQFFGGSPNRTRGSPNILNMENWSKSIVMDRCIKYWLESLFGSISTVLSCWFTSHHHQTIIIVLWWNSFSRTKFDTQGTLCKVLCTKQ